MRYVDGIGALALGHGNGDRRSRARFARLIRDIRGGLAGAVHDSGEIADAYGAVKIRLNDDVADLIGRAKAVAGFDGRDVSRRDGSGCRALVVGVANRTLDRERIESMGGKPRWIELDQHLAGPAADERHL